MLLNFLKLQLLIKEVQIKNSSPKFSTKFCFITLSSDKQEHEFITFVISVSTDDVQFGASIQFH